MIVYRVYVLPYIRTHGRQKALWRPQSDRHIILIQSVTSSLYRVSHGRQKAMWRPQSDRRRVSHHPYTECHIILVQSVTSSLYRVSHHPYTECHIILIQSVTSSLYRVSHHPCTECHIITWQAKSNVKTSKRPSHCMYDDVTYVYDDVTYVGKKQCEDLKATVAQIEYSLVVVSPLTRCQALNPTA
jgi:hypothetical protein